MTEHPLSDDLTQLSLDDLEKRQAMLTQRYYAARRMNMNQGIIYQLDLLLQGKKCADRSHRWTLIHLS